MSEYSKLQIEFMARVASNECDGTLVLGWSDESNGLTREDYMDHCSDLIANPEEWLGGAMPSFEEWRVTVLNEMSDDDEFSVLPCDCCGSPLYGPRHKASIVRDGEDSIALMVCSDCGIYIANGEVPDDEYLSWMTER